MADKNRRRAKGQARAKELPELPKGFEYRLELAEAATPRLLRRRPVHRWFAFPHSYSPELVEALLQEWKLPKGAVVLDPFVGAGTTLRTAQEWGYRSVGADLSPLAVLVSRAKTHPPEPARVRRALSSLQVRLRHDALGSTGLGEPDGLGLQSDSRLERAFTLRERAVLSALRSAILALEDESLRDFFLVALLSIVPEFSRAQADGGWFRWVERPERAEAIAPRLWQRVEEWTRDLEASEGPLFMASQVRSLPEAEVLRLDAREAARLRPRRFDALITSPPYPNRHDYTRVFHVELLLLGIEKDAIFDLRYRSLRSHVEARAPAPASAEAGAFVRPVKLQECLKQLKADGRVRRMLEGYFQDLYLFLRSAREVLKPGAPTALVVGNVRYGGVLFPVDEILVEVGEQAGYRFLGAWVVRLRGNSAQQMGRFGRLPSRETIVFLERKRL